MIFAAIGLFTIAFTYLLNWRRAIAQRTIRWELYRKRDELRRLALDDERVLNSQIFDRLDSLLTAQCAMFNDLSIWTLLPALWMADHDRIEGRQRDFEDKLNQPHNRAMKPIYDGIVPLFARHLMWRHLFLTIVAAITIVGIAACVVLPRWFATRLASDAIRPTGTLKPA